MSAEFEIAATYKDFVIDCGDPPVLPGTYFELCNRLGLDLELSQLLIGQLGLRGPVFDAVSGLSFGSLGFVIVGAFVVTWAVAFAVFKVRRVEERWTELVAGE